MKYKYFIKKDIKKEAVGIIEANNIEDAEKFAAKIKNMNLKSFLKLFSIEEL